jgi:hypothetical protein
MMIGYLRDLNHHKQGLKFKCTSHCLVQKYSIVCCKKAKEKCAHVVEAKQGCQGKLDTYPAMVQKAPQNLKTSSSLGRTQEVQQTSENQQSTLSHVYASWKQDFRLSQRSKPLLHIPLAPLKSWLPAILLGFWQSGPCRTCAALTCVVMGIEEPCGIAEIAEGVAGTFGLWP